jgi:hypothetical protein
MAVSFLANAAELRLPELLHKTIRLFRDADAIAWH